MKIENNTVRCTRYSPSHRERQICSDILNMVNELAPSDSFVEAHIDQEADGSFKARISVDAIYGNFKSETSDYSFLRSLKKAQREVLENIEEWKNHRFLHS